MQTATAEVKETPISAQVISLKQFLKKTVKAPGRKPKPKAKPDPVETESDHDRWMRSQIVRSRKALINSLVHIKHPLDPALIYRAERPPRDDRFVLTAYLPSVSAPHRLHALPSFEEDGRGLVRKDNADVIWIMSPQLYSYLTQQEVRQPFSNPAADRAAYSDSSASWYGTWISLCESEHGDFFAKRIESSDVEHHVRVDLNRPHCMINLQCNRGGDAGAPDLDD